MGPQAANPNSPEAPAAQCGPLLASSPPGPEDWVSGRRPALADAQASSGQAGDRAEEPASRGLLRLSLRKQEPAPGRQPRQRRASGRREDKEGQGQKDFTLAGSPFREPEGRAGGRAGKTPRSLLAGFTLESPRAAWGRLRAPRHPHSGHLAAPARATSPPPLALVLAQMLLAAHLHWFSGARAWRS